MKLLLSLSIFYDSRSFGNGQCHSRNPKSTIPFMAGMPKEHIGFLHECEKHSRYAAKDKRNPLSRLKTFLASSLLWHTTKNRKTSN
jgi:hypothetical protein